ncbi:MAG: PQQ-binding-like beta-propeller repeat protein, partial [Planctomycetia bacterium]|nr:PQQ-binding-like beta-propeller repeat protein [Planctomycetia bacterium]
KNGKVLWAKNLVNDYGGRLPTWGYSATPLIVDDKVIVNPGAAGASLVALDRMTGKVMWKRPGPEAAYSSFIIAKLGGRRQIVGYDAISLGGWDPAGGKRLWKVVPELAGDFNVPMPIPFGGRIFVATENNGSRLYEFKEGGMVVPVQVAKFADLAPDAATPIIVDGMVFGCWDGKLYCLDARRGLKMLWEAEDDAFADYVSIIGGNGRVLIVTLAGELLLLRARRDRYELLSRQRLFDGDSDEIWSHPALVGSRLYLRSRRDVRCLVLN